jgi:hypothetical protein
MDLISTGLRHPRRDPFETHADIFRSIPNWVSIGKNSQYGVTGADALIVG